jgi:hypothetical protein
VPSVEKNGNQEYNDEQISNHIFSAVVEQIYSMYKVMLASYSTLFLQNI